MHGKFLRHYMQAGTANLGEHRSVPSVAVELLRQMQKTSRSIVNIGIEEQHAQLLGQKVRIKALRGIVQPHKNLPVCGVGGFQRITCRMVACMQQLVLCYHRAERHYGVLFKILVGCQLTDLAGKLLSVQCLATQNQGVAAFFVPETLNLALHFKQRRDRGAADRQRAIFARCHAKHTEARAVEIPPQHRCTLAQFLSPDGACRPAAQGVFAQKIFAAGAVAIDVVQRCLHSLADFLPCSLLSPTSFFCLYCTVTAVLLSRKSRQTMRNLSCDSEFFI